MKNLNLESALKKLNEHQAGIPKNEKGVSFLSKDDANKVKGGVAAPSGCNKGGFSCPMFTSCGKF